jgi:phosphotransferase system enzyme I (PtsI)
MSLKMIRGTPISAGIAHGRAYVVACALRSAAPRLAIGAGDVAGELARFETALDDAERDLVLLKQRVAEKIGANEADIFAAQILVLRDPSFHQQVRKIVEEHRVNLESALAEVIEKFTRRFDEIPDAYLRERAADIRDVGRRVLTALIEGEHPDGKVPEGAIVVADELLPSATASLELSHVKAFVTEHGGKFSHAAILARSLGTPAVTGIVAAGVTIKTGDDLIVDGVAGTVYINPDAAIQREYDKLEAELHASKQALQQLVDLPSVTLDGTAIPLKANVGKLADTEAALLYKADGIGLYRTEFGYSVRNALPSEDEQYEILKMAAERFHPRPVVFRLLDMGADKTLSYLPLPASRNPSLSERGIRLLLKHPEVMKAQLRAFLRVSADHPVQILIPVVGGLEDVRQTRAILRECQEELSRRGLRYNPRVPLGAMIEVPSAALLADALAREVDFFSLGTNDLVQYVLAADREDESNAPYYQPLHPAVLRLIRHLANAAAAAGRPLSICGDMGGDPLYTELLIGMGLREFSVPPGEILDVKNAIRGIRVEDARALAAQALELGSVAEIEALLGRRQAA